MKLGVHFGLVFCLVGCAIGAYFGLAPVYAQLQAGALTGQEAGLLFSLAGLVIGAILATAGRLVTKHKVVKLVHTNKLNACRAAH
jgi:hypothetical protein